MLDIWSMGSSNDSAVRGESVIEQIRFFTKLMLNVDEMA